MPVLILMWIPVGIFYRGVMSKPSYYECPKLSPWMWIFSPGCGRSIPLAAIGGRWWCPQNPDPGPKPLTGRPESCNVDLRRASAAPWQGATARHILPRRANYPNEGQRATSDIQCPPSDSQMPPQAPVGAPGSYHLTPVTPLQTSNSTVSLRNSLIFNSYSIQCKLYHLIQGI